VGPFCQVPFWSNSDDRTQCTSPAHAVDPEKLLNMPLINSPDWEILYSDRTRYTYRDLSKRINRLANGLRNLGINPGDTVAVFDYDSSRYLECFFAIPMMGAILQTVNGRLCAEQILYTTNPAEAKVTIINSDFFPILENIRDKLQNATAPATYRRGKLLTTRSILIII